MATKAPAVVYGETFYCESCGESEPRPRAAMIAHLTGVHGVAVLKGTRTLRVHLDLARAYQSTYGWTLGDVTVVQVIVGPRGRAGG